jgi:hypothetical protein
MSCLCHVGNSKSANKRDYDDKGTYDNLREGNIPYLPGHKKRIKVRKRRLILSDYFFWGGCTIYE